MSFLWNSEFVRMNRERVDQYIEEYLQNVFYDSTDMQNQFSNLLKLQKDLQIGEPHSLAEVRLRDFQDLGGSRETFDNAHNFEVVMSNSSIPLNNAAYPRGIIIGGIKFPLASSRDENNVVAIAPNLSLKFPFYRVFSLPNGCERQEIKRIGMQMIAEVMSRRYNCLSYQLCWINCIWQSSILGLSKVELVRRPLLIVDGEWVAKKLLLDHPGMFNSLKLMLANLPAESLPAYVWRKSSNGHRDRSRLQPTDVQGISAKDLQSSNFVFTHRCLSLVHAL